MTQEEKGKQHNTMAKEEKQGLP